LRIAFYMAATWAWTPEDLEQHGVGGTETAMGNMARAFARLGHETTVFHASGSAGTHRGVHFRPASTLDHAEPWDVFVSLSHVPDLQRVRAAVKVHWCMEHIEGWVKSWGEMLPAVDAVFTISPYHTALLLHRFRLPAERLHTTCCPIDPEEYAAVLPKVAGQLIYCSVPDRGLRHLPAIFQMARIMLPDLRLVVTSDFTLWGLPSAADAARELFHGMPGVDVLGRVPRPRLVQLQKRSVLHLYPCVFQELFCLASMECQAAGTPSVTSDMGALPTTVEHGATGLVIPLGGRPQPDFDQTFAADIPPPARRAFAARVVELVGDPTRLQAMGRQARERALGRFGADAVARAWLPVFGEVAGRRRIG